MKWAHIVFFFTLFSLTFPGYSEGAWFCKWFAKKVANQNESPIPANFRFLAKATKLFPEVLPRLGYSPTFGLRGEASPWLPLSEYTKGLEKPWTVPKLTPLSVGEKPNPVEFARALTKGKLFLSQHDPEKPIDINSSFDEVDIMPAALFMPEKVFAHFQQKLSILLNVHDRMRSGHPDKITLKKRIEEMVQTWKTTSNEALKLAVKFRESDDRRNALAKELVRVFEEFTGDDTLFLSYRGEMPLGLQFYLREMGIRFEQGPAATQFAIPFRRISREELESEMRQFITALAA